jgi:uncharacterized protein YxjI
MNYPLTLTFKTIALSPQITVTDADGKIISYVKQKAFKLREHVEVFNDTERTQLLCDIRTDKVIDFSATYRFTSAAGEDWGCIRRQGMRSILKASYEIVNPNGEVFTLNEDSGWIRVADGLFGSIPLIGMLSGLVFHPSYTVTLPDGTPAYQVKKQSHLFEGKFIIEKIGEDSHDALVFLSILMMTLLEKNRG